MPLYEYECEACGERVEVIQRFSDPPPEVCAKCGKGPLSRMASSPAIQFKGSGFYINDYAQKGKSDSGGTSAEKTEKSDKADGKTESKTESKTEGKPETKSAAAPTASSTPPSSAKS
ncbi:MAG TPA: zinc ribbon domain-containing protein [Gemmatimonadaceae bacterium]|nr:zinc ribbon domain-containing protein [Gemmatimonadaceae bacterium]